MMNKVRAIGFVVALISFVTSSLAEDIRIQCDRVVVYLRPDGSVAKATTPNGVIAGVAEAAQKPQAQGKKNRRVSTRLVMELQQTVYGLEDGKRRELPLDVLSQSGDHLVFTSSADPAVSVAFQVTNKNNYLTLSVVDVQTPQGEHALTMTLKCISGLRMFPLNAEVMGKNNASIQFTGLLRRSTNKYSGAVALWYPETEQIDDDILAEVWVKEGLPHPKINGEWTVPRAKQWVADYIEKFSRYGELYITGDSLQELKGCVDHAAKMGIANVYMHINSWAGRYHPTDQETYALNKKLFPNGHDDFKELCDYAKTKGVGVTIRTLSHSISLKNPVYVSNKPDKRLAHFWRGTLVKTIDPDSSEIIIKSDQTLPTTFDENPRAERRFVHIGDEILSFHSAQENNDGTITLKVATHNRQLVRGYGRTTAAAHKSGTAVRILTGTFTDKVAPDPDSSFVDEIAAAYAAFNNRMQLSNSNFDGLMLHTICAKYGDPKFVGSVYSQLDHPTWPTTSNGLPKWGFFELDFNSVKQAMGLKKTRGIPQRMTLMLGLHQDHWAAPSPFGYTYGIVPNAVAGYSWCSIQEQTGFHDVRLNTFKTSGLIDLYSKAIDQWRTYGPGLPDAVKERIFNGYDKSGKYPTQIEHFRFDQQGEHLDVVPFQPMRRKVGDRGWAYLQEHGPIYTYQYMRPNTQGLQQVNNPYHAQVPQFIIRVMQDFDRDILTGFVEEKGKGAENEELNKWLDEMLGDSRVTIHDKDVIEKQGKVNYRIMIPENTGSAGKRGKRVEPGEMELERDAKGARISYENRSDKLKTFDLDNKKKSPLVTYIASSSIYKAKGLGVVITGDGSNAMFVVRIRGGGTRDYVIPIDFVGKRYIEIPDPQVSWSEARWPITSAWKRWKGHTVKTVLCGFGTVPPKTKASVFVEDIRLLPEKPSALTNPVIQCGSGSITLKGVIPSDRYIYYPGGDTAHVFDLDWMQVGKVPVVVNQAEVPSGRSAISVKNNNKAGDPWLECQFFVSDQPIHRVLREREEK